MRFDFAASALTGALLFATAWAHAQAPMPLPTHAVRSIAPTDADFRDLEFLKAEIGPARVVMLGEPTHGEGNVFEAKIRLMRFLREQMGFTTVAFESGFYDLHKAQQALEAGRPVPEVIGNSVFPVWTSTQEFQSVLPLLGAGKLRVAGFDPQLMSEGYSGDLVDDLEAFLVPQKAGALPNYDYLDEVISFMAEQFAFLPTTKLADFEKEMAKATRLIDKAAASPDPKRRAEATFWQQNLRSLLAQARDYAAHDANAKLEEQFVAVDSNPRDAQMADNLLWYLRQHPQEKVVCWAALPHLANRTDHFENAEIQTYRPMGRAVKEGLGPDQVYILGTLAGGGTHGFPALGYKAVPAPAAGSLEAELLAQPADYAFVSLKHDAPGQRLTTYAFDYQPLAGPWSEAVDGFLFLRSVNPPHGAPTMVAAASATPTDSAVARPVPTTLNPAGRPRQVHAAAGTATVRGVVLDQKTGQPVPYASVSISAKGMGTVADAQGRFALPAGGEIQVSSVGYATATVAASAAPLTVRLAPAAYELAGVQVRGESLDPRKIMKKVLAALPKNYEQADYVAEVYTHRRLSNFDTLRYEAEYISQVFEPAGYRNFTGGFLGLGPREKHRVREAQVLTKPQKPLGWFDLSAGGQGFYTAAADPVRTVPLFKPGTWRKFTLHLDSVQQQDDETVYVLSFVARRANHRSTGTYLTGRLSGRFYVQQRDYAVRRYQALWEHDTLTMNAIARQHAGRHDRIAPLYNTIYSDDRTDHFVEYERGANGRYHVAHSVAHAVSAGRVLGKAPHHHQIVCEAFFTPQPAATPPLPPDPTLDPRLADGEIYQLFKAKPHPEFWRTYQRPTAGK
ncbi:erythromycin esterase family protein [Microvirga sp. STS02]|uniref:erythromycin esterase family protein n=1 Tax=Hymenobacter negativus TaxID=2795026 RepID=UPI0018DBB990|nr:MULTISPECIES: erythromycin esterase family protein [Bacteria]MBH8570539.1 erythromycin esterase family protein [Hymenobacter negativus]MBR7210278.1 erythromycin esterase family protein [Microvirga sp. STS02]